MKKLFFGLPILILAQGAVAGSLNIQSGAVMKGSGTVSGGDTTIVAGGELSPGDDGFGCLATDKLTFASGASLALDISGVTACSEHDKVTVTGNVNLNSATLNLDLSNYPDDSILGDEFTIIDNDGNDAISGTFDGLSEGTGIGHTGNHYLFVSYVGGDGNDVTLTTLYAQSISFAAISDQEYGDAVTLSATASSGLSVSFASDTTSVCSVSGSTVTLLDLGACSITAYQTGDSTYHEAVSVTQTFSVSQGSQTITFAALADREFSDGGFTVSATSDSGLGVALVSDTPTVCSLSGVTLSLLDTGTCSLTASQDGSYFYQAASNITRSFTVTSDNLDDDNDGVADEEDAFPLDPTESVDSDSDGVGDNSDAFPNDDTETADNDGDGLGDNADTDDDNDGVSDDLDAFPFDPDETTDSDSDGVGDNSDAFPNDAGESADSDADGVGDNSDVDVDGDGLIEISSVEQLYNIRNKLNGTAYIDGSGDNSTGCGDGVTVTSCSGYELANDIDFDEDGDGDIADEAYFNDNAGWEPIGDSSSKFTAKFEGNGFSIFNLYVNRPSENYVGLFGYANNNTMRDISVSGSVTGLDRVGMLCGACFYVKLYDVEVSGDVSGDDYVGGIGGMTSITASSGLHVEASIDASGNQVGGLFGYADSLVTTDAIFIGTITGDSEVGGLVGLSYYYTISDSYVDAEITASGDKVGGILGFGNTVYASTIESSFAIGSVSGANSVGGLLGRFEKYSSKVVTLQDSYAANAVSGDQYVGGLVGYGDDSFNLYRVYAAGTVTASSDGGGLLGGGVNALTVSEAYWDTESTGQASSFNGDGIALTTAEMQCPVAPGDADCGTSAYSTWDNTLWDFGTASQYPALIIDDVIYRDDDGDGVWESEDAFPDDASEWDDSDGDGVGDNSDALPDDPTETVDSDGDGVGDNSDAFPSDASESADTDSDGVGDNADVFPNDPAETTDSDGDGVGDNADEFPDDATESVDTDGDGVGDNADAFPDDPTETTDTDGDGEGDNAEFPSLAVPADLTVISAGYRTPVDLGTASAEDADDGQLTPTADDYGPYTTGRHIITWSVTNSEDYTVTDTQVLDVIPLATVTPSAIVEEGDSVDLTVTLNGSPVSYPVTIPYTITGTAEARVDHDLSYGDVTIAAGLTASLTINTVDDGVPEGDENVLISLVSATNAALGATSVHDLTITETNVAPTVEVIMEQGGETVATAYADGGNVTLTAMVVDPNADDTHVYDWSLTDSVLVPSEGYEASTFTFDPTGLNGAFDVAVIVMDDQLAAGVQSTSLRIEAITPTLSAGTDSDNDTLNDADEGVTDSNGNRVADYLDPASDDYLLAVDGEGALMEGESGQRLALGDTAYGAGLGVSRLSLDELATAVGETDLTPDDYEFIGDVFDFEIRGLQSGESSRVVLPLSSALLENAEYLKYVIGEGWVDFVEDDANGLASAEGALGVCPAPGSAAYSDGLSEGHYCVQLTLEDGGPNDADGEANGIIKDPGVIAAGYITPPTVTVAMYDPDQTDFAVGDGEQVVFGFTLTSDSSDAMVDGLTLQASGTLDDATVGEVTVYLDSNGDGIADASEDMGSGSYDSDNGSLSLEFDSGYQLPVGDTTFLVTYPF